jgi:hypothetical protein
VAEPCSGDGPTLDDVGADLEWVQRERFADAITWLAAHDRVQPARVSAVSISGGAKWLTATFSRLVWQQGAPGVARHDRLGQSPLGCQ